MLRMYGQVDEIEEIRDSPFSLGRSLGKILNTTYIPGILVGDAGWNPALRNGS